MFVPWNCPIRFLLVCHPLNVVAFLIGFRGGGPCRVRRSFGEPYGKMRPLSRLGFHFYGTPVLFHHLVGNKESQARTRVPFG